MLSESVLIPHSTQRNAWTRVYRASQTVRAASGASVTLIAVSQDRAESVRELAEQLEEYQAAKYREVMADRAGLAMSVTAAVFGVAFFCWYLFVLVHS